MNKLKYEQAVAESSKRGVVRSTDAANDIKSCKTKSTREKFEKDKRATGSAPRPAAAAPPVDRGLKNGTTGASTANGRHGDVGPRDPAVSSVETSGCQSNVHAETPVKPRVKRAISVTKLKTTSIPVRQVSQEVTMPKSPNEKRGGCPKTRASCPTPTFIFKPKTNESNTSPADCREVVQDDRLDDEPANLINNESMEELPQVDTNFHSSEADNENSDFDTVELEKNDTSDENIDEDTPSVLEISNVTLIGERELNDECMTSCLEAESTVLSEKPEDPVLDSSTLESSKESPEYSGMQDPSLNGTGPVLDSNQEKTDEHVDEDKLSVLETSDVTSTSERELNDEFVTSSLEANSVVLSEKPEDPVVLESSKESSEYRELQPPSLNGTVPVLDSSQEKAESTKSLRARFEALHNDHPDDKPTPKANRISQRFENLVITTCESCEKKVYPLEKIEIESRVYHKTCFKCSYCQCLLRMDSFTRNCNRLYCMPHFKQLFKTKGNYDQGFSDDTKRN